VFCKRSRSFFFIIILLVSFSAACRREEKPRVERLAIVPFENLSSSNDLSWAGPAIASALVYDLAPAPGVHAQMVEGGSGALASDATEMLEGYFVERNGRLEMSAALQDLRRAGTIASFEVSGPANEGVLPLVNQLAKRINGAARPFGTKDAEAFREYELALSRAAAAGNAEDRASALEQLTRLTPADVRWFRELADLRFSQRRFPDAVQNYQAMTRLARDEAEIWNQLGYAYALAQDLTKAREALEQYRRMLGSNDSNALDSLGEVSFYLGDFSAAERSFLEAAEKNAGRRAEEFRKAAQARLMLGDLAGADALAEKSRRGQADFERVQWEFLTGRRKSAMARLAKLIPTLAGNPKSFALSQLAIWKVQTGAGNATEAMLDAYALVFAGRFREALPKLEALYRETNPTTDGQVRTLLAWAYVETKRIADARDLVEVYPIPLSSGNPLFASLMFPRFLEVRGAVLASEGRMAEAKRLHDLFVKYSGDVPDAVR